MKRKVIKKFKQLETELFDIYDKTLIEEDNYALSNLRREAIIKQAQIELLEELLGEEHLSVTKMKTELIFKTLKIGNIIGKRDCSFIFVDADPEAIAYATKLGNSVTKITEKQYYKLVGGNDIHDTSSFI